MPDLNLSEEARNIHGRKARGDTKMRGAIKEEFGEEVGRWMTLDHELLASEKDAGWNDWWKGLDPRKEKIRVAFDGVVDVQREIAIHSMKQNFPQAFEKGGPYALTLRWGRVDTSRIILFSW